MELVKNGWDILLRFSSATILSMMGTGGSITILMILMGFDILSDLLNAKLNPSAGEKRKAWSCLLIPLRKLMILGILFLSRLMDQAAGVNHYLENGAMGFYLCQEGISLLRNAAALGVPVPGALRRALEALGKEKLEKA